MWVHVINKQAYIYMCSFYTSNPHVHPHIDTPAHSTGLHTFVLLIHGPLHAGIQSSTPACIHSHASVASEHSQALPSFCTLA